MKLPKEPKSYSGFQLLTKEAQDALSKYEHTVICLMVLIAVFSILWSLSIHLLSRDFSHEFIRAKLRFSPRDLSQLNEKEKGILNRDLEKLLNEVYVDEGSESNEISEENINITETITEESTTRKPKVRKIAHVFQSSFNNEPEEEEEEEIKDANTTEVPKVKFNVEKDRKFLSTMAIDVHQTVWQHNTAVQFIYSFPFLSETVSIVWTAMCLIFQSSVKKHWGLPKPWRIVVPSMIIFSLMSLITAIYTILANKYLSNFCTDLRMELSDPNKLSCGQAISVLRPKIEEHKLSHDVYLNLFRSSYIITLVLWLLALLIMFLRYKFAIDFQLVDISPTPHNTKHLERIGEKDHEFTEVLLHSPRDHTTHHSPAAGRYHRSEDDFQSARSQLSEIGAPLVEGQRMYTVLPA